MAYFGHKFDLINAHHIKQRFLMGKSNNFAVTIQGFFLFSKSNMADGLSCPFFAVKDKDQFSKK